MSDKPMNESFSFNGLILSSIPKKIHKFINLWIAFQAFSRVLTKWYRKYQEKMQYTVTINGSDDLYTDIQTWLFSVIPSNKKKGVRVTTKSSNNYATVPDDSSGRGRPEPQNINTWYDGVVEHKIVVNGHTVRVRNDIKDISFVGGRLEEYNSFLNERNKLIFVAQSVAGRDAILEMFNELARKKQESGRTASIYVSTRWGSMRRMSKLSGRTLSTVILPDGVLDNLTEDMELFLSSENEYAKLGIPWHRGYLFYGKPGTGKTSLATALATHFDRDIYCVSLSSLEDDTALNNSIGEITPASILLLEDVDIVHASRDRDDDKSGVTMQGLLNILDGLLTPHGLITIMTTNRETVLDDAIIRAGRIDRSVHIGKLRGNDISRLITMFVGPNDIKVPETLELIPSDVVGLAKEYIGDKNGALVAFSNMIEKAVKC